MCMCAYIYIYIYICVHSYIYIYTERERDVEITQPMKDKRACNMLQERAEAKNTLHDVCYMMHAHIGDCT